MCTVSVLFQYGQERIPDNQWTRPVYNEFLELIGKAADFDKVAGQLDCADPGKEAWLKRIEERLECIEKLLSKEAVR